MTIKAQAVPAATKGDGSNTRFDFEFPVLDADDLKVYITDYANDDLLTEVDSEEYTVYGVGDDSGYIIYPKSESADPLPATSKITIYRETAIIQGAKLDGYAEVIEQVLDRAYMVLQEIKEIADRCLAIPIDDDGETDPDVFLKETVENALLAITQAKSALSNSSTALINSNQALADSATALLNSTNALSVANSMSEAVTAASDAAKAAAATSAEALLIAEESSHAHTNKESLDLLSVDTAGSYVLKVNEIEQARADLGNVDTSAFVGTDGANADAESFRSLVGMPEVEDDISDLEAEISSLGSSITAVSSRVTVLEDEGFSVLCYAPQSIIAGATGDLPDGWTLEDCDAPAAHIFSSGTSELTIVAGLQVAAGYEGQIYVSEALLEDKTLDIADLISGTDGTGWIYSDIGTDGSQSFGYTENQPQVGIQKNDYSDFVPTLSANTDKGFIVSISSSYSTEYPPYKGYDGVITQNTGMITSSSAYSSLIGNESMYIELESGEAFETNGIMLMPYAVSSVLYGMPANFTIDGSDDGGENWTNVFTATGITDWKVQTYKRFTWDKVSYKKYRINCTKLAFSTYFALTEIKWLQPLHGDFYNIAKQTHYDDDGNSLCRVYIGEVEVSDGVVENIINYQHGTICIIPVNDGEAITTQSIYYLNRCYPGLCTPTLKIYAESHWGSPGCFSYSGFSVGAFAYSTDGELSVHTALTYLSHTDTTALGEFDSYFTSALCKLIVKRVW